MSLHVLSHPWEVQELEDGIRVRITHRDLDVNTIAVLIDELSELALESGRATLYLDFGAVHYLAGIVPGKLLALDRRLREVGGHLVLCHLDPVLQDLMPTETGLEVDAD